MADPVCPAPATPAERDVHARALLEVLTAFPGSQVLEVTSGVRARVGVLLRDRRDAG